MIQLRHWTAWSNLHKGIVPYNPSPLAIPLGSLHASKIPHQLLRNLNRHLYLLLFPRYATTSVAEDQAALIAALSEATPKVQPAAGSRFRSPDSSTCFRCRQLGHFARDCTISSPRRSPAQPGLSSSLHNPQCSLCFGWGHFAV